MREHERRLAAAVQVVTMAAALVSGAAVGVSGQRLPPQRFAAALPRRAAIVHDSAARVPTANLVIGGVAGGVVGGFIGATAGYYAGGGGKLCGDDSCGLLGGLLGLALGEGIGVGAGVNLADRSRGNGLLDVLGSLGAGALGLAAAGGTKSTAVLALAAAAQLGAAAGIERATSR